MSIRVEGMGPLRAALLRVSGEGRRVAEREIKRAALNVEGGAKRRAPVDTGRLRNSITHEMEAGGLTAVVGTNVSYAGFVEFGTRRTRAHPYLFPAWEEERGPFLARLRRELGEQFVRSNP